MLLDMQLIDNHFKKGLFLHLWKGRKLSLWPWFRAVTLHIASVSYATNLDWLNFSENYFWRVELQIWKPWKQNKRRKIIQIPCWWRFNFTIYFLPATDLFFLLNPTQIHCCYSTLIRYYKRLCLCICYVTWPHYPYLPNSALEIPPHTSISGSDFI